MLGVPPNPFSHRGTRSTAVLEELDRTFMLESGLPRVEGAEVPALAGPGIELP
jgi:hypothetical protein